MISAMTKHESKHVFTARWLPKVVESSVQRFSRQSPSSQMHEPFDDMRALMFAVLTSCMMS